MVARSSPACIELSCGELHASVQARKDQINQDASASSQLTLPPRLLLEALLLVDLPQDRLPQWCAHLACSGPVTPGKHGSRCVQVKFRMHM